MHKRLQRAGALVKTYEGAELSQCIIKKVDPFSADEAIFTGRDYQVLFAWPALSGRYAAYAYIIPGTVKVNIGDTVVQGQVLGNLGNSGNSTAPHLHFHLCNGRDGPASEGLPFSFAQYDLLVPCR